MADTCTPSQRVLNQRPAGRSGQWHPHNGEIGLRVLADIAAVLLTVLGTAAFLGTLTSAIDAALALTPAWILVFFATGLYDPVRIEASADEVRRVWQGVSLATALTIIGSFWIAVPLSRPWLVSLWIGGLLAVAFGRAVVRASVRRLRSSGLFRRRVLIVGGGESARALAESLAIEPGTGAELVGYVGWHTGHAPTDRDLGHVSRLPELVGMHGIQEVLVAPGVDDRVAELVAQMLGSQPVTVRVALGIDGFFPSRFAIHSLGTHALVAVNPPSLHLYARVTKRTMDICVSLAGLILASPVLFMLAILVKLDSRGPVLFGHPRVGRHGRTINVYKFRTMVSRGGDALLQTHLSEHPEARAQWAATYKLIDDPRVTRVGRLLRKLSLDELPQLINVLKGQMALVGPRPVLPDELERFGQYRDQLLDIKPGVTGWWQVNGRNDISYEERARLELTYVRNWSVALDLLIILKTIRAVLRGEGR